MLRKAVLLLALSAGATLLVAALMPAPARAAEAAAQGKVGPKVGKPLGAAVEALNKTKNYDECIAKAKEADAIPEKTPYEQAQVDEVLGVCYLQTKDYADAATYFEKGFESGQLPADKVNDRLKLLAQLFYQIRDLQKAASYGSQWLKATGGSDVTMLTLVGQAYYLDKKCEEATGFLESATKSAESAGAKPDENSLLILQQCYAKKKDVAGVNRILGVLLKYYPKQDYWDSILANLLRQAGSNDRVMLDTYRLMNQVDVLKTADQFTEMATLSIQQGSPGDAVTVMEKGYSTRVLETSGDKARSARILADAKKQAEDDQKALPQVEKEARGAKQGEADVRLGQAFLSYGQTDKAVEAIQRGIQKGGVKNLDDAYLLLGQALLKQGKAADAGKAFSQVQGADVKQIAELWSILAGQG